MIDVSRETSPLSPAGFARASGVSAATLARLVAYAEVLGRWQARINLIGAATLPDLWRRHMLDSWQLLPLLPEGGGPVVDLGSGAGFPGLVLAICGAADVHLVESDARKAAFLREAARVTATPVTIHATRAESLPDLAARAVTARALAPLPKLLGWAAPLLQHSGAVGLFLKGGAVDEELTEAAKEWKIVYDRLASVSDPTGTILRVKEIHRAR